MIHPQPLPISQLIQLLYHQNPLPTQLEITILPDRIDDNNIDDNDYDDSDYYYLKDGIHLGIHAPNVPNLARTFRQEYYSLRKIFLHHYNNHTSARMSARMSAKNVDDNDDSNKNENENDNNSDNAEKREKKELEKRLWESITCLVLLCPDHATAWSDRKRILLLQSTSTSNDSDSDSDDNKNEKDDRLLSSWQEEIQFLNLLFTQHSKAPNSWSHRKWISKQMISQCTNTSISTLSISSTTPLTSPSSLTSQSAVTSKLLQIISDWTKQELDICTNIAERYPKNYYAWTHRRFVIDTILLSLLEQNEYQDQKYQHQHQHQFQFQGQKEYDYIWQILEEEFTFINSVWIVKHVSDHSAIHYGGEILRIMVFLKMKNRENALKKAKVDDHINVDANEEEELRMKMNCCYPTISFYHSFNCRYFGTMQEENTTLDNTASNPTTNNGDGDGDGDNNIDDEEDKWILNKMEQSLMKSKELITKYPSNEVIWIWRRVCSQIYIHYLYEKLQQHEQLPQQQQQQQQQQQHDLNNDIEKQTMARIHEFIQQEIKLFVNNTNTNDESDVNDVNENNKNMIKDEYDERRNRLYSTTYILWLVEHLQLVQKQKDDTNGNGNDNTDGNDVPSVLVHTGLVKELKSNLIYNSMKDENKECQDSGSGLALSNMWIIKEKDGQE